MQSETRPAAMHRVPPPLAFLVAFLVGLLLQKLLPIQLAPGQSSPLRAVGSMVALIGLLLLVSSLSMFASARTTVIPHHQPSALVTRGGYRLSRNPMYVAMSCIYLGISIFFNVLWPVLLLPLPIIFLHTLIIPHEERMLHAAFGEEYADYGRKVRRWL